MSKKDRHKLEKKKRKELKRLPQKPVSLAYKGNKYKNEKYLPLIFQTEAGIYESFVMQDHKLTDHDVRRCLEELIRGIRSGKEQISTLPDNAGSDPEENVPDFLTWNIRLQWQDYLEKYDPPARDDAIGVLRTIMSSIETWGTIDPESRGYLRYLSGFMGKLGIHCKKVPGDAEIQVLEDDIEDDELLASGRAWIHDSDKDAAKFFQELAEELIKSGEGEEVAETCQQLMGESGNSDLCDKLGKLSIRAQQQTRPSGSPIAWALSRMFGKER